MLKEKNLGTTFYIQYDPSLLKKEKDICLYVIKRPEVTQHIVVSGGILGDLCFLFKTCLCFSNFLQMSPCDCFFSPNYKCCKNVSPHSTWHQKRPLLFRICRQKDGLCQGSICQLS